MDRTVVFLMNTQGGSLTNVARFVHGGDGCSSRWASQITTKAMLRYIETANKMVAFFNDAEVREDVQIAPAGRGLLELLRLAESAGKGLTLSFHGVQSLASAMIGPILLACKAAKHRRVTYRMANVSPSIMEMFRAARLHKVLRCETLKDAEELRESSVPVPLPQKETGPPCPECGEPLATKLAKQCLACGADWH